jgi:small subunit ribosomal protein S16
VAEVGSFDPQTKKTVLNKEKVEFYLKNGAQPSTRVARVLSLNGVKLPSWVKAAPVKQAKAKHADKLRKNQPKEEPVEEAPAEVPAEEAPATEA